jgi:hypothetical protein
MVDAGALPKTPLRPAVYAEPIEKLPVCAAAAPNYILFGHAAETNDDVTPMLADGLGSPCGKAPQPRRAAQRQHRNAMGKRPRRSFDAELRAEKMNLMSEVSQSFGGAIQISFCAAFEIKPLVGEGNFHPRRFFRALIPILSDSRSGNHRKICQLYRLCNGSLSARITASRPKSHIRG